MKKPLSKAGSKRLAGESGEKIPQLRSPSKKKIKGTPGEIMGRHISNEEDIISDEEFKNLRIGTDIADEAKHKPLKIERKKNRPKDEDKDPIIKTPWDVIN